MSLDNVITLSVDEDNDGLTPVDIDFTRQREPSPYRTIYTSENNTPESRDSLTIYVTEPKPSANFKGVVKSTQKFSKDHVVTGIDGVAQLTAPLIAEVSWSIPVGVSAADRMLMRQRVISLLDDDTLMEQMQSSMQV